MLHKLIIQTNERKLRNKWKNSWKKNTFFLKWKYSRNFQIQFTKYKKINENIYEPWILSFVQKSIFMQTVFTLLFYSLSVAREKGSDELQGRDYLLFKAHMQSTLK